MVKKKENVGNLLQFPIYGAILLLALCWAGYQYLQNADDRVRKRTVLAITHGDHACLRELLDDHPWIVDGTALFGKGVAHWIVIIGEDKLALFDVYLSQGGQLDAQDADGNTPLHYAAEYADVQTFGYLIAHGADESAVNAQGIAPKMMVPVPQREWFWNRLEQTKR